MNDSIIVNHQEDYEVDALFLKDQANYLKRSLGVMRQALEIEECWVFMDYIQDDFTQFCTCLFEYLDKGAISNDDRLEERPKAAEEGQARIYRGRPGIAADRSLQSAG